MGEGQQTGGQVDGGATGNQTQGANSGGDTAPQTPPQTSSDGGTPSTGAFYQGFQDPEVKGYAELKGFKDPEAVVRSYRDLEKLHGVPKERLLKLPEKMDDAEAMEAVFTRLGRPEKPEGYELPKISESQPEDTVPFLQETFHKAGLSPSQATRVAEALAERAKSTTEAHQQKLSEVHADKEAALKQEWGAAYEQNMGQVVKIAQAMGLDEQEMLALEDTLGVDKVAKGLYGLIGKFGIKLGEDDPSAGDNGAQFALSPAAAQARIQFLKGDQEWTQKYLNGSPEHVAEMNRLQRLAFPSPTA